jgi:NAD(P)-dependent dehydrogenase (short-subunit alcohol dehydrogenase family)
MPPLLNDRIALVTGASRGIGAATARALAKAGAHVVAVARTVGGLEELDDAIGAEGGSATLVPLDLKDMEGIARLGAALNERYGRLDILVGNAGMLGPLSPLGHVEPKAWDEVMTVNVTANWQLIRCMDPLLRLSSAGRAVFVGTGVQARPYWGPYAASKAALDMMVRVYAAETERTPVRANVINPGRTRTRMRAQALPGEDPETLPPPDGAGQAIVELCSTELTVTGGFYDFPSRSWRAD